MAIQRIVRTALGFFFFSTILFTAAAIAQNTIRDGETVSPNRPKLAMLHAPKQIAPPHDLPVYVSVKAGEANLKEIVWSFESPPYAEVAFGSYRIKPGEEKEVAGHFTLSTLDALRTGSISNTEDLILYIRIWARDVEDRSSEVGAFDVTLNRLAPKNFDPPKKNMSFAKNFGVIEGRIVPPISDASEVSGN